MLLTKVALFRWPPEEELDRGIGKGTPPRLRHFKSAKWRTLGCSDNPRCQPAAWRHTAYWVAQTITRKGRWTTCRRGHALMREDKPPTNIVSTCLSPGTWSSDRGRQMRTGNECIQKHTGETSSWIFTRTRSSPV